jgi:hypothetical protein
MTASEHFVSTSARNREGLFGRIRKTDSAVDEILRIATASSQHEPLSRKDHASTVVGDPPCSIAVNLNFRRPSRRRILSKPGIYQLRSGFGAGIGAGAGAAGASAAGAGSCFVVLQPTTPRTSATAIVVRRDLYRFFI